VIYLWSCRKKSQILSSSFKLNNLAIHLLCGNSHFLHTKKKSKAKKSQKCVTSCCCNQRFGVQLHISFRKKIRKLSQILDVTDSFSQIKLCLCFLNPRSSWIWSWLKTLSVHFMASIPS
jgi:hypothetical protein